MHQLCGNIILSIQNILCGAQSLTYFGGARLEWCHKVLLIFLLAMWKLGVTCKAIGGGNKNAIVVYCKFVL